MSTLPSSPCLALPGHCHSNTMQRCLPFVSRSLLQSWCMSCCLDQVVLQQYRWAVNLYLGYIDYLGSGFATGCLASATELITGSCPCAHPCLTWSSKQ